MKLPAFVLWLASSCAMLLFAALPLSVEAQLAVAVAAIALMAAIKLLGLRGPFRGVFLGLGTFVILRYVLWRLFNTVPPVSSPLNFAAGLVLLGAELYCITMLFLSLFTVADPIDRPRARRMSDEEAPTVDVFVPSYNESVEIVAPTLAAAKRMAYPAGKVNVFLLDDGGTEAKVNAADADEAARARSRRKTMQMLCAELGVRYLARQHNSHAKAGNLNNGLEHSDGDIVAVFDADHIPAQDFLNETVGFFGEDENLFLVQTPHFFLNPDPIERNVAMVGSPAENEMFYSLVQKGLDKWNSAFFCGSAALLRRTALEQIGGFHGSSITEDAESALELHARGWNSLYVDRPLISGLQPETFESFIGQRSRWCRGMMQILLLKNPLFKRGLTFAQRLSYLSSCMFWLFPLSRMIFIAAPMLFIFLNMKIYVANSQEFIAYTAMYMISTLLIQSYMFRRVRWPWVSDVYEYILAVKLFRGALGVFVDPRRPRFQITDKGQSLAENRLSSFALPYFAIFGVVATSVGVLCYRYVNEPATRGLITVMGVWSLLNLLLTGIALGAVAERRERRSVPRIASQYQATLMVGSRHIPVSIEDVSLGGLRVRALEAVKLPPGTSAILHLESDGGRSLDAPVTLSWRQAANGENGFGLRFYGTAGDRFRIIAGLGFSSVTSIHRHRVEAQRNRGVVSGTVALVATWAVQVCRGVLYAVVHRGSAPDAGAASKTERSAA